MRSHLISLLLICILLAAEATLKCGQSVINGVDSSKIHFDDATKTLSCVVRGSSLMAIEFNSTLYKSLKCDEDNGWQAENISGYGPDMYYAIAEASTTLNIACVEYCAFTTGEGFIIEKTDNGDLRIECRYPETKLYHDQTRLLRAWCFLDKRWIFEYYRGVESYLNESELPMQFECRKVCDQSLIKGVDPSEINFDDASNTLTCVGGEKSLMTIEINSTRYNYLTCDETNGWQAMKWIDDQKKINKIADASGYVNISCAEYCAATELEAKGIQVENTGGFIEISCPAYEYQGIEYQEKLFYDQFPIYHAYCGLGYQFEWMFDTNPKGTEYIRRKDFVKPAQFECRLELPTTTTTTTERTFTRANHHHDGPIHRVTASSPDDKVPIAELQSAVQTSLILVSCLVGGIVVAIILIVVFFVLCKPEGQTREIRVNATKRRGRRNSKRASSRETKSDVESVTSER